MRAWDPPGAPVCPLPALSGLVPTQSPSSPAPSTRCLKSPSPAPPWLLGASHCHSILVPGALGWPSEDPPGSTRNSPGWSQVPSALCCPGPRLLHALEASRMHCGLHGAWPPVWSTWKPLGVQPHLTRWRWLEEPRDSGHRSAPLWRRLDMGAGPPRLRHGHGRQARTRTPPGTRTPGSDTDLRVDTDVDAGLRHERQPGTRTLGTAWTPVLDTDPGSDMDTDAGFGHGPRPGLAGAGRGRQRVAAQSPAESTYPRGLRLLASFQK